MAPLLVGFFSDFIGRRKTILYSLVISVVGIFMLVVMKDLVLRCIGLMFWGIGTDIIFPVGVTYIMEIIAE